NPRLAPRADARLRGASRLVDARARGTEPAARLRRDRAPARRARAPARLHARRADADHGASLRRLVGLPGVRLLRADVALRDARRLPVPRRHAPPGGYR